MSCDSSTAFSVPSGKSPEKPPRAITSGSFPARYDLKNQYAEQYEKQCCRSQIMENSGLFNFNRYTTLL